MKFLTKTFSARKGSQVKVTFSQATGVKLMSKRDLAKYRKSQTHTYWGGDFKNSPVVFGVPRNGQWSVVVEKGTRDKPLDVEATIELVSGGLEPTALPGGGAIAKPKQIKETAPEENYASEDSMMPEGDDFSDDDLESKPE
jgi:hypothetical protein